MNILGIDIGGTNVKFAVFDQNGNLLRQDRKKTADFKNFDELVNYIDFFIKKINIKINGIGIGAPNGNSQTERIEFAPNLKWGEKIEVVKILSAKTGLPVRITNDANAIALAELKFGYGKKYSDFLVITLGTGLGSGIIVNGKLLEGSHGIAGELGHTTLIPGGRKCSCGRYGCLEEYVSARGISQTYYQLSKTKKSPDQIANDAAKGLQNAILTFELTAKYLALGLVNFIHLFDSQAIIFYGGIANSYDLLASKIFENLNNNLLPAFKGKIKLHLSVFQNKEGAALGAASLFWT